jgi:nucleoside phosphorylase
LKILVTFALENEFAPWRAMHRFHHGKWGAADAYFCEIGEADVGVILTGVGPRYAWAEMAKIVWDDSSSIGFCISSGLTGALRPEYQIGQLLAARTVVSGSVRNAGMSQTLESSNPLIAFAGECGGTVVDRFHTAEHVIARAEDKRRLGLTADAVDMESFEVMLAAKSFGVPAIAIRAVSDEVDADLPAGMNEVFKDGGRVSIPRVLSQAAQHPQSIPGLVRLGQQSKRAAESLAQFLESYVLTIALKARGLESRTAGTVV